MSNALMALIWWVVPLTGLLGALGYVLWVTQFKSKFESETTRSVTQFQRFQESFRDAEITVAGEDEATEDVALTDIANTGEAKASDAP
ncbi:MAG: hypothetical protein NTV18_01125 [Actinobacteria bacterium]|nr:hypothetical protein [Actinomycetota bacterium]